MLALASAMDTPSFSRPITLSQLPPSSSCSAVKASGNHSLFCWWSAGPYPARQRRCRLAVEPYRAPEDAAVAGKAVLPDPVREDDDFVATDDAFLLGERSAQRERVP